MMLQALRMHDFSPQLLDNMMWVLLGTSFCIVKFFADCLSEDMSTMNINDWIIMNENVYKCTPVASSIQVSLLCWKVEAQLLCWAAGSRQDSVACVHDHSDAAPWQTEGCWSVMPLCICWRSKSKGVEHGRRCSPPLDTGGQKVWCVYEEVVSRASTSNAFR